MELAEFPHHGLLRDHQPARQGRQGPPPHIWLILHTGAKKKDSATKGMKIADPAGLLNWLAKDRCLVTFDDAKDIRVKRAALQAIVRAWIRQL